MRWPGIYRYGNLLRLALCLLFVGGCCCVRAQDIPRAPYLPGQDEVALRATLAVSPHDVEATRRLAGVLERTGRSNAALALRRSVLNEKLDKTTLFHVRFDVATSLVETSQSGEAIPLLRELAAEEPMDEAVQFELGTALARMENFDAAANAFMRATQLDPSDRDAQLSAAKALVTLLRYQEAGTYLEAGLGNATGTAETDVLRGVIAMHTFHNAEAIARFREALEKDPSNPATLLLLGSCLLQEHQAKEAVVPLTAASETKPSIAVYFQLVKAYHSLNDADKERSATASLRQMQEVEASQQKVDVLKVAAEHAVAEKRFGEAARAYETAFALFPRDGDLLYRQALATGQMGDRDKELQLLRKALALSPGSVGALSEAGIVEGMKGESAKAKQDLREALRLDPQRADALSNLAVLVARDGDLALAEIMLRNAIESNPSLASAYRSLGLVYAAEGRPVKAEAALKESVSRCKGDVANFVALGKFYQSRQQLSDALTAFRIATALEPDNVDIHLSIAKTLSAEGKVDEAFEEVTRGLILRPDATEALALRKELCMRSEVRTPHLGACRTDE